MKFNLQSTRFWFILACAILVSVYAFLLFAQLGEHAFIDSDEGIYAQVVKENFESVDKTELTFFGQPWFEKPPLLFWLSDIGFSLFGVGEFGARFFIAFAAVITMGLAGYCAHLLFKSQLAVLLTLASFFFFPQVFASAFFLNMDTLLTLWVLLSLIGYAQTKNDSRWWLLFFGTAGLAIMTKGIAGLFPLIIASLLLAWNRDALFWRSKYFWWGVGLAAFMVLPWHIVQTFRYGQEFWNNYLLYHFVDRYTSVIEHHGAPFNYFFDQLLLYPGLALLAISSVIYVSIRAVKNYTYRLPLVALLVIFFIVSSSKTKLLGYAIPMYPFLALCMGSMLAYMLRLLKKTYLIVPLTIAVMITFVYFGFQMNAYKIAKAQANLSYEQSKQLGLLIKDLPNRDKRVVVGPYDFSALPSLSYYAGKKLERLPQGIPEPDLTLGQRIKHTNSKSLYEFPDYYYVHIHFFHQ